ncbi:MAG: hypothetical protein HY717_13910 [Planctomycetes bacterium]|nr:hypothetical protein [Planctomycetota bacterium]
MSLRHALFSGSVFLLILCLCAPLPAQLFPVPLRINMGGPEVVDSQGRVWLGDGFGPGDALNIRPDDAGGANTLSLGQWFCGGVLEPFGFNSAHPGDQEIFGSIRWDDGNADAIPYLLELPIPNGSYLVNLYFYENCCPNRHYSASLEGAVVDPDISHGGCTPGRRSFDNIAVADESLSISILPCLDPACPGGGDANSILSAIEVVVAGCGDPAAKQCASGLACPTDAAGVVTGTWSPGKCITYTGYELRRDGEMIQNLPGDATQFTDTPANRYTEYELVPAVAAGEPPCPALRAPAVSPGIPFEIPLRLNMGGPTLVDRKGQKWIGDGGPGADFLQIRPDDAGGSFTLTPAQWGLPPLGAIERFGFNSSHSADREIFGSIRWDNGGDMNSYQLDLPVPNGDYLVNLYFFEACCPQRHFQVHVQGQAIDADLSMAEYQSPNTGRLSVENTMVTGGLLNVTLLPLAAPCPAGLDCNAILSALEVLPSGPPSTCPNSLSCAIADGKVTGAWNAGENVIVTGYKLYRNGALLGTLPANATSFEDQVGCQRASFYEVEPLNDDPDFFCPGQRMTCTVVDENCRFDMPLRINMGSVSAYDSQGNLWLGDGTGPDPLGIRPNDAGGANIIGDFVGGNTKPASYAALGFDASNAGDRTIFNSIRWDFGADVPVPIDYALELPVAPGVYDVSLYFNEGCCPNRHAQIEIEGAIADDDVSAWDFDPAADRFAVPPIPAGPGFLGRLNFPNIVVGDGSLSIRLLPCPTCFEPLGGIDTNPILNALEVFHIPSEELQLAGDSDRDGSLGISDIIGYLKLQFPGFFLLDRQPTELPCDGGLAGAGNLAVLDINGDGRIDMSDAIYEAMYLFTGGRPPVQGLKCMVPPSGNCKAHPSCQ